jgi:hypothetical protein
MGGFIAGISQMSFEPGVVCKAKLHGKTGARLAVLFACARIFFLAACGQSESFHARDASIVIMCAKGSESGATDWLLKRWPQASTDDTGVFSWNNYY